MFAYMATQPPWSRQVAARIKRAIRQSRRSEIFYSEQTGIALSTLRRRLAGITPWTLSEVEAVAKALDKDPDSFLASPSDPESAAS